MEEWLAWVKFGAIRQRAGLEEGGQRVEWGA